jgi:hypothetical protein
MRELYKERMSSPITCAKYLECDLIFRDSPSEISSSSEEMEHSEISANHKRILKIQFDRVLQ